MKKTTGLLVLASAFLLAAKPATAADYLFLRLPGVTGTSTVGGHLGDIPLLSFSAGVSAKKGAGSSCSDISVMKLTDQTSPLLFVTTLAGVDYVHATLIYAKSATPGDPPADVFTIVANVASITSVQESGSSENPVESVSLHATSWVTTYTPPGGAPVTTTVTCK
jgi:type VI protein secretion system component Hcp